MTSQENPVTRFEELEAWQCARSLVNSIYSLTRDDTLARDFGLIDQIRRAAVSIMSNIAEGFERMHLPEKSQFYNVARSSAGEVRSLLYVIEDNYPACADVATRLRDEVSRTGQLVSGLIRSTERRRSGGILGSFLALFC